MRVFFFLMEENKIEEKLRKRLDDEYSNIFLILFFGFNFIDLFCFRF